MVKAQKFFGGTSPKQTGSRVRQVGSHSATPGVSAFKNNAGTFNNQEKGRKNLGIPTGSIDPRHKVKQVGTFSATPGVNAFKNNSKQLHREEGLGMEGISTKEASRPNLSGKVDNRRGKGNGQ